MTEKRFTVPENYRCIQDNLTKEHYLCEDKTEAINLTYLLNELVEENTRLKKEIETGKEYCKTLETDLGTCADNRILLQKENKQLKCGNKNLKAILNDFINICNRLQANPTDKQTLNVARDMLQNMGVDLE